MTAEVGPLPGPVDPAPAHETPCPIAVSGTDTDNATAISRCPHARHARAGHIICASIETPALPLQRAPALQRLQPG